jgi:hypothetical protein
MIARMFLVIFVVGGLFYFTQAMPVDVDISVSSPYLVPDPMAPTAPGIRRGDVERIDIRLRTQEGGAVWNLSFFLRGGMGPEPTKPSRIRLSPGLYLATVTLVSRDGRKIALEREFNVDQEGPANLDLR